MSRIKRFFLIALLVTFSSAYAGPFYDEHQLSPQDLKLYQDSKRRLDQWQGSHNWLVATQPLLEELIKRNPQFSPAYIELARLEIMFGHTAHGDKIAGNKKALAIIKQLQEDHPAYYKSYVLAGDVYSNLGDIEAAKKQLKIAEAMETAKADPWLYENIASILAIENKFPEAYQYYVKVLETKSNNPKAISAAMSGILKYEKYSKPEDQEFDLALLLMENFNDIEILLDFVDRLNNSYRGDSAWLDASGSVLERIVAEHPDSKRAKLALVDYVLKRGFRYSADTIYHYTPEALVLSHKLLESEKDWGEFDAKVLYFYSIIYPSQGSFDKLQQLVDTTVRTETNRTTLDLMQAHLDYQNKDYPKVLSIFARLIKENPDLAYDKLLMETYERTGDYEKLRAIHEHYIKLSPNDAWVWGNYARFLLNYPGDMDGAIEKSEKALSLMNYGNAKITLALAYYAKSEDLYEKGKFDQAKIYRSKAKAFGYSVGTLESNCFKSCEKIRLAIGRF